ncbi:MAG: type II toxin-antitoxin system HicA family toxin [bacterium]|nr:type II toxin-antitoxin system HicA family toxin [bacterium]
MPKLKILSGKEVIKIFISFNFEIISQKGSHVKLRRTQPDGLRQTLTIPNHEELDRGTIRAIYRQAVRYISEQDLSTWFYSE